MVRYPLGLPAFASIDVEFIFAAPASPRSDFPETMLSDWMRFARRSKSLREAARVHYARMSSGGLITAVIVSSAGGLTNILLGASSATGAYLNLSQVALGFISVVSATIISAAKQLQ